MSARSSSLGIVLLLSCLPVSSMEGRTPQSDSKGETDLPGSIAAKFREYKVILEPDKNEAEWWAVRTSRSWT